MNSSQGRTSGLWILICNFLKKIYDIKPVRVIIPFFMLVLLWQASFRLIGLSEFFYPSPVTAIREFVKLLDNGILLVYIRDSLYRYAWGCLVGIGVGIPVALVLSLSRRLGAMFLPVVNFFQAIVELAWLPLFVIWFGYGFKTIVLSLSYVVAFPVMFNTLHGIRRVPYSTINAVRVLGGKWYHIAWQVMLPGALPDIVTGIRLGASYAFRGLVGAEMIAARTGMGYLLFEARQQGITGRIVVGMVILGLLWLFIDRVYLKAIERATIEKWGMVTTAERG